jgi:hypothetical protein
MDKKPRKKPYVRRVVLPSGREIEVVYFEDPGRFTNQDSQEPRGLEICPQCQRDLVYPVWWEEAEPPQWRVFLRCPNCEWNHEGLFDQNTVDHFDEKLGLGTAVLLDDHNRLSLANMEYVELPLLIEAFSRDLVSAADFAVPRNY